MRKYYWAGFESGKIAYVLCDQRFSSYPSAFMPAIFRTKREAKEQFEDVRKVEIKELQP